MHKVRARKLRPWEGQKLKRMKRQLSNAVNSRHARMILLSGGGLTNGQIAERVIVRPLGFAGSFTGLIEGESTRSPGILITVVVPVREGLWRIRLNKFMTWPYPPQGTDCVCLQQK